MITFSLIQKSRLEGASRVDAEYYQPEYLKWQESLNNFRLKELNEITSKVDVGFVSSMVNHFQDSGIPLLRTQNVQDFVIDLDDVVYIDEEFHKKLKKSQVFPSYLLLARSGSIGNVGVVPQNFPESNSADIILIKVSSSNYLPEFLAAFLNSQYGRFQVERGSSGGLQGHINLFTLEQLKVPEVSENFQKEIADLVKEGISKIEESKKIYQQSEDFLLEELGLKDFQITEDLNYMVNYSDTEKVERVDADYFQPKYEKLCAILKKQKTKKFLEIIEDAPARFIPKPDEIYKYIELANINSSIGIIDGFAEVLGKEAPSRAKRLLKTGDVLVSSIQGSLDKTALVDAEQSGCLASTGFFQFRSNEILPEALLVLAKSIVLQWQLGRECSGTILSAVPLESLKRLIVPVLSRDTQIIIADLVKKSHEARKKSKELLEEAKRKVEEMIEDGGD